MRQLLVQACVSNTRLAMNLRKTRETRSHEREKNETSLGGFETNESSDNFESAIAAGRSFIREVVPMQRVRAGRLFGAVADAPYIILEGYKYDGSNSNELAVDQR